METNRLFKQLIVSSASRRISQLQQCTNKRSQFHTSLSRLNSSNPSTDPSSPSSTQHVASKSLENEISSIRSQLADLRGTIGQKSAALKKAKVFEKEQTLKQFHQIRIQRFMTADMIFTMTNFHNLLLKKGIQLDSNEGELSLTHETLTKLREESKQDYSNLSDSAKAIYQTMELEGQKQYLAKLESCREMLPKKHLPPSPQMKCENDGYRWDGLSDAQKTEYQQEYEKEMLNL